MPMPIITAKYAPPSIMACANASLTVESQHVSVGSNSFAALFYSEINLHSRHLCKCSTQNGTNTSIFMSFGVPKTKIFFKKRVITKDLLKERKRYNI